MDKNPYQPVVATDPRKPMPWVKIVFGGLLAIVVMAVFAAVLSTVFVEAGSARGAVEIEDDWQASKDARKRRAEEAVKEKSNALTE